MKKLNLIFLFLIVIAGAFLRTYKIDRPVADWHSWRQADTASVTRYYVKNGINLFVPKFDDLGSIPSGLDNPEGYRMVEFPFVNALVASTFSLTSSVHNLPIHTFSRLASALFSLGSIVLIYLLVSRLSGSRPALISAAVFAFLPFNTFYSTTILPEVPLVFFSLASLLTWTAYCQTKSTRYLPLFILLAAAALLLKPTFLFFAPAMLYLLFKNSGIKSLFKPAHIITALLIATPLLLWRYWISQFPSGIPSFDWLFNSTKIRFTGAFFNWLFAERIGKLILGFWGLIPFGLGILAKPGKKSGWFYHWLLVGVLLYLTILATGNVTHDYYQVFIIPVISIFSGLGYHHFLKSKDIISNKFITHSFLLTIFLFTFAFSWFHIRDFYNINNPAIVAAGLAVDQSLPSSAKVIAPYMGDTAFLYQTNRQGWPIGGGIKLKVDQGATHYVTTTLDDEANQLIKSCSVTSQTDQYTIIDLGDCAESINF